MYVSYIQSMVSYLAVGVLHLLEQLATARWTCTTDRSRAEETISSHGCTCSSRWLWSAEKILKEFQVWVLRSFSTWCTCCNDLRIRSEFVEPLSKPEKKTFRVFDRLLRSQDYNYLNYLKKINSLSEFIRQVNQYGVRIIKIFNCNFSIRLILV